MIKLYQKLMIVHYKIFGNYSISLILSIGNAAERENGIYMLEMPGYKKRQKKKWRKCVSDGYLWYNNASTHGTHVIKIEDKNEKLLHRTGSSAGSGSCIRSSVLLD